MYLKISPKEALRRIDFLIKEGYEFRNSIFDDYGNVEEKAERAEVRAAAKEERELKKLEAGIDVTKSSTVQFANQMKLMSARWQPRDLFPKEKVSEKVVDAYFDRYYDWNGKVLGELGDIFQHFAHIYRFKTSLTFTEFENPPLGNYNYRRFIEVLDRLDSNLRTLVSFYDELKILVRNPLVYLEDKAQICFYDFIQQLEPSSNEAALCKFMFQFSVGEWKEFADVYDYISGGGFEDQDRWDENWKSVVNSAYDGINRKTNKVFDFPILKKQKLMLSLNFPSRLVSNLT
jgi:hypothetical protein